MSQPTVILGGFLSFGMLYSDMREALMQIIDQPVWIVETQSHDWLPGVIPPGWSRILHKLDRTVRRAANESKTGRVTLIGHSAGGVLGRLYLSTKPFMGHAYRGLDYVDHLITLGSPHYNQRRFMYGKWMSQWVNRRYPGACFAQVRYTSIAGRMVRGDTHGSLRERHAYTFYRESIGQGDVWGDGLVPVASALLDGSLQITLDGVGHFMGFGGPWYGDQEILSQWWQQACTDQEKGDSPK